MSFPDLISAHWVAVLGWTLVHFVWQGLLIHGLLTLVLWLIPVRLSDMRYGLACMAFLLMAAAPISTAAWLQHRPVNVATPIIAPAVELKPNLLTPVSTADVATQSTSSVAASSSTDSGLTQPEHTARTAPASAQLLVRQISALLPWLVGAWFIGSGLLLLRICGGLFVTRQLRTKDVTPVPATIKLTAQRLAENFNLRFPVKILQSGLAPVPMVVGIFRPVILLPASAISGLTMQQLELLLAHELAHVRRFDPLVNLLQNVIETLLFYHPSVWAVSRTIRQEREHCCDAAAVGICSDPILYANTLSDLASLTRSGSMTVAASGGSLAKRVRRVLRRPERRSAPHGLAAMLLVFGLVVSLGSMLALAQETDPIRQLIADPQLSTSLTTPEFVQLLHSAPDLEKAELLEFLRAVAPFVRADHQERASFLWAAQFLSEPDRGELVDLYLAEADLTELPAAAAAGVEVSLPPLPERDAVGQAPIIVGPNEEADYRSIGFALPPLLEPGFNLADAGLESFSGEVFPAGHQFVFVRSLMPPSRDIDRSRLLENLDLARFRQLLDDDARNFHILLAKFADDKHHPVPLGEDFSVEELQVQTDVAKLEGPWSVWVDAANAVTRRSSLAHVPLRSGNSLVVSTVSQYVCVEDGRVTGSLNDRWLFINDERLLAVYDDCLSGRWGHEWQAAHYEPGTLAPPFELHDGSGGHLSLADLAGQPFMLLVPAPEAQAAVELPAGRALLNAVEPAASVRLEQVQQMLAAAGLDLPVVVVALSYIHGGVFRDAASVAHELRLQLDVPVYEDATGTLLNNYSQFLGSAANPLMLVDSQGRIVDSYADRADLDANRSWGSGEALRDRLKRGDLHDTD